MCSETGGWSSDPHHPPATSASSAQPSPSDVTATTDRVHAKIATIRLLQALVTELCLQRLTESHFSTVRHRGGKMREWRRERREEERNRERATEREAKKERD